MQYLTKKGKIFDQLGVNDLKNNIVKFGDPQTRIKKIFCG